MKKALIVLTLVAVCALVGTVSAFGNIIFPYDGNLEVTYVSADASYNNHFGILLPELHPLGQIHGITPSLPGSKYTDIGRCSPDTNVAVYIRTPLLVSPLMNSDRLYRSDIANPNDHLDHALITKEGDGSYTVAFEDSFHDNIDDDTNDVVLNVACIRDTPIPTPEFPTAALPAGFIVGFLGVVLFMKRSKEY
jgi:hypothetical protein